MSEPLSMLHNQVRKRVGLRTNTQEFSNDEDRILDEQGTLKRCTPSKFPTYILFRFYLEQDEVINDIRRQMVTSDREHQVGIGVIATLSCTL